MGTNCERINHAEKIMQSSQNDTKLFHQLIKRQRRNNHSIDEMIFKCDEYDDTDGILEGWWSYFTDLFGNSDQGNFDTEKLFIMLTITGTISSTPYLKCSAHIPLLSADFPVFIFLDRFYYFFF
jgi:hypothetical protein